MLKFLLNLVLVTWLMSSAYAQTELVLDLNNPVDAQLLPTSLYHSDAEEQLDFTSAQSLEDSAWTGFNREQFRLGFIPGYLWVKASIRTTGNRSREIAFKLHHSLDNQRLKLSTRGEEARLFSFGQGVKPTHFHDYVEENNTGTVKSDHIIVRLSPNKTYHLLLRSNSVSPIVSDFRVLDDQMLVAEHQVLDSWLYAYLLLTLLLIFYSCSVFTVTHNIAYLYHATYIVSLMVYLLADSGYISGWFDLYNLQRLQQLTLISLTTALVSGYLILKTSFNDFKESLFESHQVLLSRANLLIFTPLIFVYLLTKLGFVKVIWLTDYALFLGVFIEIFLISGILLLNLRSIKKAFQLEELTHRLSSLPNNVALEKQFLESNVTTPQTLLQVWVSGFDGLQTTLGPALFREFLVSVGQKAKQQLNDSNFLTHSSSNPKTDNSLFHSDQNTFILLCKPLDEEDQQSIIEIVTSTINSAIDQYHEHFDFKVSIGAYILNNDQQNFEKVIQRSVLALSDGIKNNVSFNYYTDHIGLNEARRNRLITDFYHSLENEEFFLLWQPQYDTRKNTITGVEVLARWKHAEYGLVGPDEFIPLLEQSHRISDLTKWVINKVFNELPLLHQSAGKVEVSINLSTRDLSNNELVELLNEKLKSHAELVPYVTMEITESMMIDDYQVVLANVNKLQQLGFKVSIDDFGSGYASFAYLQSLPADELKIDKCYTDRFEEPRTSAILESVIELAKNLNINIVVEGIESAQQIERFTKLGVDRLQGWALGKPMSLDDLILKAS